MRFKKRRINSRIKLKLADWMGTGGEEKELKKEKNVYTIRI